MENYIDSKIVIGLSIIAAVPLHKDILACKFSCQLPIVPEVGDIIDLENQSAEMFRDCKVMAGGVPYTLPKGTAMTIEGSWRVTLRHFRIDDGEAIWVLTRLEPSDEVFGEKPSLWIPIRKGTLVITDKTVRFKRMNAKGALDLED